ncbi:MAG: 3-deoxy-8-phosphooctulonate synthase, partial [Bdellovibrionales bacterium]|nr:3-deoxy-8-phosphooctulonate synthase [Oligoflexia bacterium]
MTLIAGPCVIEDEGLVMEIATELKHQLAGLPIQLFFKASFDKANRSSIDGFRGPGMVEGLRILGKVKDKLHLPVLTDVHNADQAEEVAKVVDFLQVPAFLCRQTDLIVSVTEAALNWNRKVN